MSDIDFIKDKQMKIIKKLRDLKSLEEIAQEFHLNDENDPMLYFMYKYINQDKLFDYEIKEINYTIDLLKQQQQKINDYNYNICSEIYTGQ